MIQKIIKNILLLTFLSQGQTSLESINKINSLSSPTFNLWIVDYEENPVENAEIIINTDTINYHKEKGYQIPIIYLNEKIDLRVFHPYHDTLFLRNVSLSTYTKLHLFKNNEQYYIADGIKYPLTKYGKKVLAVRFRDNIMRSEEARKYIEKIVIENGLVLGVKSPNKQWQMDYDIRVNRLERCYFGNLFWIQKNDSMDWSSSDSSITALLRNDTNFNAVGIPVGSRSSSSILVNEAYITFDNKIYKQTDSIIETLKPYNPRRVYRDSFWIITLPDGKILYDDLIEDLMKTKGIKFASPVLHSFVCE